MSKEKPNQKKILNRRARYDYEIHSQIETGVILKGNEIKSIRFGKVVLDNAYAILKKGEIWMMNLFIDLKNYNKKFENTENLPPISLWCSNKKQLCSFAILKRGESLNSVIIKVFDIKFCTLLASKAFWYIQEN